MRDRRAYLHWVLQAKKRFGLSTPGTTGERLYQRRIAFFCGSYIECLHAYGSYHHQTGCVWCEPTVRGMRITVSHVLEMLAGGMTAAQVLQDFPYLEKADIEACLEYAARHAAHREIPLSK